MENTLFVSKKITISDYTTGWSAPSNIALIKYWGKEKNQIPKNPSLSFTLSKSVTETTIEFFPKEGASGLTFDFFFEGMSRPEFLPKLNSYFEKICPYVPWLEHCHLIIQSKNTFPHSSGIASSASAMAALSVGIMDMEQHLFPELNKNEFFQKASFLARLGSGSAARSLQGPLTIWGKTSVTPFATDDFANLLIDKVHPIFNTYQDTILLVDKGSKTVSSSQGHQLMNGHPFAHKRFEQAHENLKRILSAIQIGDLNAFIAVVESEALTLHAMMMTSQPYFILMEPNTLEIIHKVWNFRKETDLPLCFTLDAGANVHLLYPENIKTKVLPFISAELSRFCQEGHYILDEVGHGIKKL